ncbi:hypothetical protein E2C01_078810 [Portunus trituberculatus]|uniref:Uncharacterized protein n=1 Tax=Portunus trituberculatus TaxID=210409 RepID=A0A5B7INU5_PORTR|nr:hypothetical protein [Portunus trituberculatus]
MLRTNPMAGYLHPPVTRRQPKAGSLSPAAKAKHPIHSHSHTRTLAHTRRQPTLR